MTNKAEAVGTKEEVKVEEKAVKKNAPKAEEATETAYPLFQLREHSRELFKIKPEVFDGVFETTTEKTFTKPEAKSRIEAFFKKEVK